jgi:hypothetical protein
VKADVGFRPGTGSFRALLAVTTPVAQAAPPEVTASPNPVVIPFTQTTGETTLKWPLAQTLQVATLTVTDSGTQTPCSTSR